MKEPKTILAIRLDKLGDIVLSLPAFASLRKNFPKAKITALVNKPFGEMLEFHGLADEAIEFDEGKNNGIAGKIAFLLGLSKRKFDFAIDLQHAKNDFSALALLFVKARAKAGYAIGFRRIAAKKAIGLAPEILYEKKHSLALLKCLGLKVCETAHFKKNNAAGKKITAFLKGRWGKKNKIICMHAGVSGDIAEKAWPKERFAALAERLSAELGAKVFLTGTKKEDSLLDFISEKSNGTAVKANCFSLNETIELLRNVDLFITNNTGPMHIAIMLGKPTIVLNAFSNPKRWVPKKKNVKMLVKKIGCWPCETGKPINCRNEFECVRGVSVQKVFEIAKAILEEKGN